jgi:hypothetical protein
VVERTGVVERAAGGRPKLSVTQDLWPARQDAFPMTAALPVDGVAVAALATMATAGFALSTQTRARSRSLVVDYGVFVLFGFFAVAGVWLFFNRDSVGVEPLLQEYWLPALFAIFVLEGAMLMYFAPSEGLVPAAIVVARTTDVAPATPAQYVLILGTAVADGGAGDARTVRPHLGHGGRRRHRRPVSPVPAVEALGARAPAGAPVVPHQ